MSRETRKAQSDPTIRALAPATGDWLAVFPAERDDEGDYGLHLERVACWGVVAGPDGDDVVGFFAGIDATLFAGSVPVGDMECLGYVTRGEPLDMFIDMAKAARCRLAERRARPSGPVLVRHMGEADGKERSKP